MINKLLLLLICFCFLGCRTTTSTNITNISKAKKTEEIVTKKPYVIEVNDISLDLETGEITYTLPKDALVRIRVGIQNGGPLLAIPLDWGLRKKGFNKEIWDFKDPSGQTSYKGRSDLIAVIYCIDLNIDTEEIRANNDFQGWRNSPRMNIMFPEIHENSVQGYPKLKGIVPIRLTIDEKDAKWLSDTKYEMGLFVDNIFLVEDEEGVNPFNYLLNVKGFNNGIHVITANIVGYEGEIGTTSITVEVNN